MQIGIISDSHYYPRDINENKREYQKNLKKLKTLFNGFDHIIHAGDICCKEFIEDLESIATVSYVRGNMDEFSGLMFVPRTLTLDLTGIKIGIAHRLEDLAYLQEEGLKIFIYGHTHIPTTKMNSDGILLINPGSLTQPRAPPKKYLFAQETEPKPTVAILNISQDIFSSFIKRI